MKDSEPHNPDLRFPGEIYLAHLERRAEIDRRDEAGAGLPFEEKGSPKIDDAGNIADDRKAPSK